MTFENIHDNKQLLLLQCISGSKAYGLDTPTSDTDIKGVFCMPKDLYYGLTYTQQVANESNDIVYYELKQFIDLLVKNNPNILELLSTPDEHIIYKDPVMDLLRPDLFLSKLCMQTFAGYAQAQIKKARGLNKKIFNPIDQQRKSIIDFCYAICGYAAQPLEEWLGKNGYKQEDCGLVSIPHARDIYALFHQSQLTEGELYGIYSGEQANDVKCSPVPEKIQPLTLISFNKDGYSAYCKDYREYWEWVGKRNDTRFQNTLDHGKNYDAKNMMHTFRLLNMAEEIAREHKINVKRADREFLLQIKAGAFQYEELEKMANEKIVGMEDLFAKSGLPDLPDIDNAGKLLVQIRETVYK